MKKNLAIYGGEKVFDKGDGKFTHPVITPSIEKAVLEQLHDTISIYDNSNIFKKFETKFAEYHNRKYALLTSSGTAALWSMYDGAALTKGDEVICPAYTFFATVSALLFTGATPVLIDCDEFGNIDCRQIEAAITPKTKAVVVTHMWGYPARLDRLREICDEHGLLLFEDCSHTHGASFNGKKTGAWGDAAIWSLQGQKIITGGEGGILLTDDKSIFERALLLGHYNKRCKQEIDKDSPLYKYAVTGKGMKLRAHPLAIRIAYEQLSVLDEMQSQKQIYAERLMTAIDKIDGLQVLKPRKNTVNSWYAMIIKYDPLKMGGVSRERFMQAMHAEGAIEVDIPNSTCPLNLLPLFQNPDLIFPEYSGGLHYKADDFANAAGFYNSILKIPVWYDKESGIIVDKYIQAFEKVGGSIKELSPI